MFTPLLQCLYNGLSFPFNILEVIFGSFGLSFLLIFTVMIITGFFVRNFVRIFF